ncbi:RNA-directed DNA polymerase from mobile element jockey-like [Gigaspora margarita]|uniref:RNA-directed DNA polymerase from mobile element jockey-like n=1 Tax=Gigaspora margarita TaxID=4874 RepID=A0A8H4EP24_GIGMA|nr:RNA-directed DNA polymerase from mobile element jockey-like [Gigaspora margarita]
MDDTLWIAQSFQQLQQILQIASSFYQMANIKVNLHKSILVSNTNHLPSITFLNSSIQTQPLHTPFKFLACWFTTNSKSYPQIKLIIQKIYEIINTLNTKKITDKQASYIINTVIIPILEYRIYNIVLPQSTCNKILTKYLIVAKYKAKLAKTTPNSTLLNHNIYGIKNIWDIQLQHHISNFILHLNNKELLGISTHIRLQQLQNNLWSTTNILTHPNPVIDGINKNTTTFKITLLLRHLDSTIHAHTDILQPYTINLPYTSLEKILNSYPLYPTFKHQLHSKHIIFLEQLTSFDNTTLLAWNHISPRIGSLIPGKTPG